MKGQITKLDGKGKYVAGGNRILQNRISKNLAAAAKSQTTSPSQAVQRRGA